MTQLADLDWRDRVYGPPRAVVSKKWDNAALLYHLVLACGHTKRYANTPRGSVRCRECKRP